MTAALKLTITDAAKQRIKEFLNSTELDNPLPALLLRMNTNDHPEGWYIGAYGEEQVRDLESLYTEKGLVLIYHTDDMKICVPQTHLIPKLDGKTLDRQEDCYVIL